LNPYTTCRLSWPKPNPRAMATLWSRCRAPRACAFGGGSRNSNSSTCCASKTPTWTYG